MSRYFLKLFSYMHAMPLPEQIKVHFKKLKFLDVAYDMGFF